MEKIKTSLIANIQKGFNQWFLSRWQISAMLYCNLTYHEFVQCPSCLLLIYISRYGRGGQLSIKGWSANIGRLTRIGDSWPGSVASIST